MSVAEVMTGAFFLTAFLLAVVLSANLDLKAAARNARLLAEDRRLEAKAATEETARYAHANARLRRHTAEHCRQHAEMTAWLASKGWVVGESAPGEPSLLDEADLAAVESPEDIAWFPEQRKGGES